MTELVMLVGIPGCGKSTFSEGLKEKGYRVHASDEIRKEWFGDASVQLKNGQVFEELHRRLKDDFYKGNSCVYDATNLSRKNRMAYLNTIKHLREKSILDQVRCVLFLTPVEECIRRDSLRDRCVGKYVIMRMLKNFQCPALFEGFDEIEVVVSKESYDYPMEKCMGFSQDNPHHTLTLGEHMKAAEAYCREHGAAEHVCQVAGCHDMGKLYTKTFMNGKGIITEAAHFYDHENAGAYLFLCDALCGGRMKYESLEKTLYMAQMINLHMMPLNSWNSSTKAMERDKKLIGDSLFCDVMALHAGDLAAH